MTRLILFIASRRLLGGTGKVRISEYITALIFLANLALKAFSIATLERTVVKHGYSDNVRSIVSAQALRYRGSADLCGDLWSAMKGEPRGYQVIEPMVFFSNKWSHSY